MAEAIQKQMQNYMSKTVSFNSQQMSSNSYQHEASKTSQIILEHQFSYLEQQFVFLATCLSALSFISVIIVLARTHKNRGQDIVLTATAALCFMVYRANLAFQIELTGLLFLKGDSWHKLSNVFMLIEYCSLIVYLARIPESKAGFCLAFGISIIIIMQEKDSYHYQYALIPLIFNNLMLICANIFLDHPDTYNWQNVKYGGLWYLISCVGFVFTCSEELNYYFLFDDLFIISTAFSLFYSWQTYTEETLTLCQIGCDVYNMGATLKQMADEKRRLKSKQYSIDIRDDDVESKPCIGVF